MAPRIVAQALDPGGGHRSGDADPVGEEVQQGDAAARQSLRDLDQHAQTERHQSEIGPAPLGSHSEDEEGDDVEGDHMGGLVTEADLPLSALEGPDRNNEKTEHRDCRDGAQQKNGAMWSDQDGDP